MIEAYFNEDCISNAEKRFQPESIRLMICDPPFGIQESKFDKHYNRKSDQVIPGYVEAPDDYALFTSQWMQSAFNVLHPEGVLCVVMGHSNLRHVLNSSHEMKFHELNHCIWKYNFGVYTKRKFVTSHYHILIYVKSKRSRYTFNTDCRFTADEKNHKGGSLRYQDLEDVFVFNREYSPGQQKNQNKLPDSLVRKLISYFSNPEDLICDFFLGNFTTAIVAKHMNRKSSGFEINKNAFDIGVNRIKQVSPNRDIFQEDIRKKSGDNRSDTMVSR